VPPSSAQGKKPDEVFTPRLLTDHGRPDPYPGQPVEHQGRRPPLAIEGGRAGPASAVLALLASLRARDSSRGGGRRATL